MVGARARMRTLTMASPPVEKSNDESFDSVRLSTEPWWALSRARSSYSSIPHTYPTLAVSALLQMQVPSGPTQISPSCVPAYTKLVDDARDRIEPVWCTLCRRCGPSASALARNGTVLSGDVSSRARGASSTDSPRDSGSGVADRLSSCGDMPQRIESIGVQQASRSLFNGLILCRSSAFLSFTAGGTGRLGWCVVFVPFCLSSLCCFLTPFDAICSIRISIVPDAITYSRQPQTTASTSSKTHRAVPTS